LHILPPSLHLLFCPRSMHWTRCSLHSIHHHIQISIHRYHFIGESKRRKSSTAVCTEISNAGKSKKCFYTFYIFVTYTPITTVCRVCVCARMSLHQKYRFSPTYSPDMHNLFPYIYPFLFHFYTSFVCLCVCHRGWGLKLSLLH